MLAILLIYLLIQLAQCLILTHKPADGLRIQLDYHVYEDHENHRNLSTIIKHTEMEHRSERRKQ